MARNAKEWIDATSTRFKTLRKEWLKSAHEVVDIYEAEEGCRVPFNILYSNTETLLPALYNSTPRPEVSRRHTAVGADRKLDSAVAKSCERALEYFADTNSGEYESYDDATRDAVLHALVPGLGQCRVRFKQNGGYQEVCYESLAYDRFIWAYARKWKNVEWVAYGHDMTEAGFREQFPEAAKKESFRKIDWKAKAEEALTDIDKKGTDKDGFRREPTVLVWEVWSHPEQQIVYVSEDFPDEFIEKEPYPFALSTKFPSPAPLKFVRRNNNLTPVAPYELYREQAEELNKVSTRITKVTSAIRVRGGYNASMGDIEKILNEDLDNKLVPIENAQAFLQDSSFDKQIWILPLDMLITVLRELLVARESIKGCIYEIMGIADILRGTSDAQETAKAQTIKNQWGTLRVKRMQRDVQVFCRDLFRVSLEFAASMFTPMSWKEVTQLPYLFEVQKGMFLRQKQAYDAMQQVMQKAQQQAQMAQQQGIPPQPPPQLPAAMQNIQPLNPDQEFLVSLPSWEAVIKVMQNQFERTYKVDVETNSTVDLEATEDKQAIGEFMNAFGQMTAGLQPMLDSGQLPYEAFKGILSETFRRFRFGRRVEEALDQMQQPQPQPDQEALVKKHQAEMAGAKAQTQQVQADAAKKMEEAEQIFTHLKQEIERLKTELKIKDGVVQEVKVQGTVKENMLKQDFAAKNVQKDISVAQKEAQMASEKLGMQQKEFDFGREKADMEDTMANMELTAEIKRLSDQLQQVMQNSAAQDAKEAATNQRHDQMIKALGDQQNAIVEQMKAFTKAITAPRVLKRDSNGKAAGSYVEQ